MSDPQASRPGTSYVVRVSDRAKRARLVLSPDSGLTVVIPRRFPRHLVASLVEEHRGWIERTEERFARRRLQTPAETSGRPELLALRAVAEEWRIEYRERAGAPTSVRERPGGRALVSGHVDEAAVSEALGRFLKRRAAATLGPWLLRLADERAISVKAVSVRAQRTLWASCSSSGAISLNRNLLFLERELVRYVLLHELCHRREMNHSPRFRRLLEAEEPRMREYDRALATATTLVPRWAR